jgi:hypothetical protein
MLPHSRFRRRLVLALWALMTAAALATIGAHAGEPADMTLELNKLEPSDNGCRAFVVVDNRSDVAFSAFKLDLVLFQPDGVIGKRIMLDLAPVKAHKRAVKAFEIDKMKCDGFGSILINDVLECRAEAEPIDNCLARLELKSLSAVQLTK